MSENVFVLERLAPDSHRVLIVSNEYQGASRALAQILRMRAKETNHLARSEHYRSAVLRLRSGAVLEDFIALDGEHFRIRTSNAGEEPTSNTRSAQRRLLRSLRNARNLSEQEAQPNEDRWVQAPDSDAGEDDLIIDGERFDISGPAQ